jgi:hypothetical protein
MVSKVSAPNSDKLGVQTDRRRNSQDRDGRHDALRPIAKSAAMRAKLRGTGCGGELIAEGERRGLATAFLAAKRRWALLQAETPVTRYPRPFGSYLSGTINVRSIGQESS